MAVEITWIGHASFRLAGDRVIYIDPWKLPGAPADGDIVFVSHAHFDHCSGEDVKAALAPAGTVVAPADVVSELGRGQALSPGDTVEIAGVKLTGIAAYNVGKEFHPKANGWLGVIVELDGCRIYYAGDTDRIEEMASLGEVDLALLPVGGKYTMTASEAAGACGDIAPAAAVPYHYGDIVGSPADADALAAAAPCKVHVLAPGESLVL